MLFTNNLAISPGLPGGSDSKESACIADDIILYIENSKDTTRKLLELINDYSKVAGYKINTQKFLELLYTNNEKQEREIKGKKKSHSL